MKTVLRKIFSPILNLFECNDEKYSYKSSHRKILVIVGILFLVLSLVSLSAAIFTAQFAAGLPFLIFFSVSAVCLIVGGLGSVQAVAKLWGNKS